MTAPDATFDNDSSNVQAWSRNAWVDSQMGHQMMEIQGGVFLHNSVSPKSGQRVDVVLRSPSPNPAFQCRLSGQVIRLLDDDNSGGSTTTARLCPPPPAHENDVEGTSSVLAEVLALGKSPMLGLFESFPEGSRHEPCPCPNPRCGGSLYMPRPVWEDAVEDRVKERLKDLLALNLGALPGQEVLCEGRLHFDYDMRRGSEDRPSGCFGDGIPFDGRDVWQFKLMLDDWKENMWQMVPGSLVNLGPHHRPRCWPWLPTEDHLPYERTGEDDFDVYSSPTRRAVLHFCIGPFGCPGAVDHEHDYNDPGAAA